MSIKKFAFIALVFALVISSMSPGLVTTASATDLSLESSAKTEEKVPCYATLEDKFADNRVMVVLNNAASLSQKTFSVSDFKGIGCKSVSNLTSVTTELANAKLRGEGIPAKYQKRSDTVIFDDFYDVDLETFNQVLCLELETAGKQNVLDVIKILEKHPDVKYAGPDYEMTLCSTAPTNVLFNTTANWAIEMISLPEAWEISSSNNVKVAVLDTGIDSSHPVFEDVIVDRGYEFLDGNFNIVDNVTDDSGGSHGTMVAGIIATFNKYDDITDETCCDIDLVSINVFGADEIGYASDVGDAINYVASLEIPIINFSGGYSINSSYFDSHYDPALLSIIDNYNGLFICSAGNENQDLNQYASYPASANSLDNVIVVGASTVNDQIWSNPGASFSGSNYGATTVDLFAPGKLVLSCCRSDRCGTQCGASGTVLLDGTIHHEVGYHYVTGTSFAAPYVTGVAALIMAKYPTLTFEQIIERIRLGVDIVYDGAENVYADYCLWGGRLNAYKALHNHSYTISTYNSTQHKYTCNCGVIKYGYHEWQNVSFPMPNGQIMIKSQCSICGRYQ